jgi:hypothetical protein
MIRTWVGDSWLQLNNFKTDLFDAPRMMVDAAENLNNITQIRYEDLVVDPERQINKVCDATGITYEPEMISYGDKNSKKWKMGDPDTVYSRQQPTTDSLKKWTRPKNAQEWRLLTNYLEALPRSIFNSLEYDYEEAHQTLLNVRPSIYKRQLTVSLCWLLKDKGRDIPSWPRHIVSCLQKTRDQGIQGGLKYAPQKASRLVTR